MAWRSKYVFFKVWGAGSGDYANVAVNPAHVVAIEGTNNSPPGTRIRLASGDPVVVKGSTEDVVAILNDATSP